MSDSDSDIPETYAERLQQQINRVFGKEVDLDAIEILEVKVPSHGSTDANSGVAALANCQWLLAPRRRCHPGSLQYMRQRESDFNRYSSSVGKNSAH